MYSQFSLNQLTSYSQIAATSLGSNIDVCVLGVGEEAEDLDEHGPRLSALTAARAPPPTSPGSPSRPKNCLFWFLFCSLLLCCALDGFTPLNATSSSRSWTWTSSLQRQREGGGKQCDMIFWTNCVKSRKNSAKKLFFSSAKPKNSPKFKVTQPNSKNLTYFYFIY